MPGLASGAACLRQELTKALKEADVKSAKLALLCQVVERASTNKEDVSILLSSFTQVREHHLNQEAMARQL